MESRNTDTSTSVFKSLDWITVLLYLILVTVGAISIYAASYDFDNASLFDLNEFSGKQILWIGLSLLVGLVILLMDYRIFKIYAYPIYGIVLIVLIVTIFIAPNTKGSHSWLVFGPVSLQPAEFGKFATALCLAKLFDSYNFVLNQKISNYFRALIIIFLPIILILLQRETGSALVYVSFIFVLYREGMSGLVLFSVLCAITFFVVAVKFADPLILGIPMGEFTVFLLIMLIFVCMLLFYCKDGIVGRNVLIGFAGSGVIVSVLAFFGVVLNGTIYFLSALGIAMVYTSIMMFRHRIGKYLITIGFVATSVMFLFSVNYVFGNVLEPHQQQRIKVALGIEENIMGAGYNVNQSKIAIGSGGIAGKGFLNGTQTKLKYVPEQHTDFIFCTIGEEEGFIGSVAVLILFLGLILRLIHIAERQRTAFERVYAYCVVSILIFHLGINVGMVIGLCPVIGIPLPFFSYGGSSLWGFTILLFILLRLDAARKERTD
ncbi:MAG: rod shape-determining protein RodA [Muribaculaceae bacterium]|nr:rod shape-determining protein RodA [Muribaculaceae bacterium]